MTSLTNFHRALKKTASTEMPSDPAKWRDEIYRHIVKMHPYLAGTLQGDIDWSIEPINEVEGSGVGHVTAFIGQTPIQIPVIVREHELAGVDIYLTPKGDMNALDKDVMLTHAADTTFQLGDRIPRFAENGTGGAGMSEMVGKIASYARFPADLKRVRAHVTADYPKLAASFDRLAKTAGLVRPAPYDTLAVEVLGNTVKIAAFDRGQIVERGHVSTSQAMADLNSKIAHIVRRASQGAGSEIVVERSVDKQATFFTGIQEKLDLKAGNYLEVFAGGCHQTGRLFLKSSLKGGLSLGKRPSEFAMITPSGGYLDGISGEVRAGSAPEGAAEAYAGRDLEELSDGEWGFMVLPDGDSAIGPVRFEGMIRTGYGGKRLVFRSLIEGPFYVSVGERIKEITNMRGPFGLTSTNAPSGHTMEYIVPKAVRFIRAVTPLIPEEGMTEAKLASAAVSNGTGVCEMKLGHGGFMCKTALTDLVDLTQTEAKAALMSLGSSPDSAQAALDKTASLDGRVLRVYGLEQPFDKEAGGNPEDARLRPQIDRLVERFARARPSINKLASSIEEMQMAASPGQPGADGGVAPAVDPQGMQDTLNAVNLLSPQNAARFADSKKEIEQAQRTIADLLYKTRTGDAKGLDEEVVREALFGLKSINAGLDELVAAKGAV